MSDETNDHLRALADVLADVVVRQIIAEQQEATAISDDGLSQRKAKE